MGREFNEKKIFAKNKEDYKVIIIYNYIIIKVIIIYNYIIIKVIIIYNYIIIKEKKEKKETIFDFSDYIDRKIHILFNGGREVVGFLKGYDQVANLIMDEVVEIYREDHNSDLQINLRQRKLGLIIIRGPNVLY
jgi:small nuclear ribonucleoprotein (snRNP)-like protein